jgi:hypothetical protein
MRRIALVMLASAVPTLAYAQQGTVQQAVQSITPGDVRSRIGLLAHDSMRGRDTPSPEIEEAARYVAAEFRRFGLEPGGDGGTYIQHYPIQRIRLDTATSRIDVTGGPPLTFPAHALRFLGSLAPDGATGPVVLVSGTPTPAQIAGAPIEGAVVVFLPPGAGLQEASARQAAFRLYRAAPAALLVVANLPDSVWAAEARNQLRSSISVPWTSRRGPPGIFVRERVIAPLLAKHGVNISTERTGEFGVTRLPSLTVTVTVAPEVAERETGPNTVGILEGSDPALRDQYIVFSAHMDHVGVRQPGVNGDSIYNGADDDASGTAAVLELAEAFATLTPRPKRSLIFLTVSGEEKGLWGSDYFAANPSVPIERIVANLNIDMIGRNWDDTVVAIGKEHSDLGTTLDGVTARHPELNMTAIDDIWPNERFYFRSDHYNFARRGVPILFFFTGTHEDYHQPGDHVEKIDAEKESRIVRLIFYLGLEVANAAEKPKWNPESHAEIVTEGR